MKIAILVEKMLPGALPKVVSAQVRYLTELGHEVEVLVIMKGGLPSGSYQFEEFLDGISLRELSCEFPLASKLSFKLPFFAFFSAYHLTGPFFVPRVVKKKEYDITLALGGLTSLTAYGLWRRRKIPYLTFHWDPASSIVPKVYSHRLPKGVFRLLLKVASRLDKFIVENSLVTLTTSQPNADLLRALTKKGNVEVVHMGCSPVKEIPDHRGDYLLTIERWDRGNTPHILLEVVKSLSREVNLIVAGFWSEDWIRESFMKSIEEYGLRNRVKVLGPVSEDELSNLYLNARAWLHPKVEPSIITMPMLEAATHGCPIVIPKSDRADTSPFVHGVNAFFPAEGNIMEYEECIDRLVSDERLAWKMGYEAWQVAKEYSWESHVRELEKTIKKYF